MTFTGHYLWVRNLGRDFHSYCFISDVKKTVKRAGGGVGRDTDWKCMDLFELKLQTVTINFSE